MTASVSNQVDSQVLNNNTGPTTPTGDAQIASLLLNLKEALSTAQQGSGDDLTHLEQQFKSALQKLKDPNLTTGQKSALTTEVIQLKLLIDSLESDENNKKIAKKLDKLSKELENPNLTLAQRQEIESEIQQLNMPNPGNYPTLAMGSGESDLKYYPADDEQYKSIHDMMNPA